MTDTNNGLRSGFFKLPIELRLEIYSHCCEPTDAHALNLLILTHTCRTMYIDINNCRRLLRHSIGYARGARKNWKADKKITTSAHPILPAGMVPLTIPTMRDADCLRDDRYLRDDNAFWSAVDTFNKLYGPALSEAPGEKLKGWVACCYCSTIQGSEAIETRMHEKKNRCFRFCSDCPRKYIFDMDALFE
ncbi:hypothetical protein BJ508DRAFT_333538 [Ascobolus immersus RN42]|uniref:F-box domain-containing protein n=1 Tax=Ascobolus immersus RN42 TaxID=1160509 RepID=A0A3N4HPK1_ASCIM|nr:hypothetical protein BJ508DRAFT_333538 [Ascobolus immersus RN42]